MEGGRGEEEGWGGVTGKYGKIWRERERAKKSEKKGKEKSEAREEGESISRRWIAGGGRARREKKM